MFCFLACSADQTLFYFGKKNQGTCRQNKLWSVHVTSALNSLPCLFDFSHSCRGHEIVSCFSYWWRVYKRQTINIYLCVHRGFAFKWTSAHISSKWQVGLTSVASSKTNNTGKKKKKPALIFGCKHLFFQKDFLLKTDIFESQYLVCVHRFSTDVPDAYFDLRAAVLVRQIVSVFLVGLWICMLISVELNCFHTGRCGVYCTLIPRAY